MAASPNIGYIVPKEGAFVATNNKLGFAYGLLLDYGFTENYAIGTEFSIITQNGGIKSSPNDGEVHMQYIAVPIYLKLKTREFGKFRPYALFGLDNNIKLDGYTKINGTINRDNFYFIREALLIGGGTQYSLGGETSLFAGFSYSKGFTNTYSDDNNSFKNEYIALNIGIMF